MEEAKPKTKKPIPKIEDDDDDIGLDVNLFGEERVNHGGPSAPPVVWKCDEFPPLTVAVSQASSTALMAHHVWQSSITLSTLLARRELEHAGVCISPNTTVVELGAGAALPSLVCDVVLHAKRTVATDYPDENVIETIRKNARQNKCSESLLVEGFDWAGDATSLLSKVDGQVDFLLAADTLWIAQYHESLLKAILALTRSNVTKLVLAFMHHDHNGETAAKFLRLLDANHFTLVHEEARDWRTNKTASAENGGARSKLEYGDVLIKVYTRVVE